MENDVIISVSWQTL